MNLINARYETLHLKPSFKNSKRCLVIADGWFEWKNIHDKKVPFYHFIKKSFFFMAGIYNEKGCAIVTTNSSQNIKHIHHRQFLHKIRKWMHRRGWIRGKKIRH